jgi:exonuclease III
MNRNWNLLDWNLRGINSQPRWDDIRQRSEESNCAIMCFQETKREHFDLAYIRTSAIENLTLLLMFLPLATMEGSSLYGMAIFSVAQS